MSSEREKKWVAAIVTQLREALLAAGGPCPICRSSSLEKYDEKTGRYVFAWTCKPHCGAAFLAEIVDGAEGEST